MPSAHSSQETRQHILHIGQEIIASKGFSAVGLNEVLKEASVPKGSFYYYFASKELFGVALLENYFNQYLTDLDQLLNDDAFSPKDNLLRYWQKWHRTQQHDSDKSEQCLVVKLGAEVSDLSPLMREALHKGTTQLGNRLTQHLQLIIQQHDIHLDETQIDTFVSSLYELWIGASIMAKITCQSTPLDHALNMTKHLLQYEQKATH